MHVNYYEAKQDGTIVNNKQNNIKLFLTKNKKKHKKNIKKSEYETENEPIAFFVEDQPGARDVDGTSGSHVTAVVHVTKIFPVD